MCCTKCLETSLILLWDSIIIIIFAKFERILNSFEYILNGYIYVEIAKYQLLQKITHFMQLIIYNIIEINLDIRWDYI